MVKELHNADTIKALNELRSTYHDCTLAIGNQTVNAHKNILVIKSDYFRALFVGPLAETDKSEVDLSAITDNIRAVNSVVDYMYSGEIDIEGAQWLSGRVLDSRPKGSGFEPHRRHCVVVLEQDTFILA